VGITIHTGRKNQKRKGEEFLCSGVDGPKDGTVWIGIFSRENRCIPFHS